MIGAALASIGASACCVGPLVLVSLGIGGAWMAHLTALEPYRPLFIAAVVLFLGLAFWRLYRTPVSCAGTDRCIADRTRRMQRVIFWIVTPLLLILCASPWWIALLVR
jgi:mercuric ion transport protein